MYVRVMLPSLVCKANVTFADLVFAIGPDSIVFELVTMYIFTGVAGKFMGVVDHGYRVQLRCKQTEFC